jgi:uncharacterized protein YcgI (DUF1989 family)
MDGLDNMDDLFVGSMSDDEFDINDEDFYLPLSPTVFFPNSPISLSPVRTSKHAFVPLSPLPEENNKPCATNPTVLHPFDCAIHLYTNLATIRQRYRVVNPFVSSDRIFPSFFWKGGCYERYRRQNDTCKFHVVDSTNAAHTHEFARLHQGNIYTKRRDNSDHPLIPLLCCDTNKRSLMWMPLDIPLRAVYGGGRDGQALFADAVTPTFYRIRDHPFFLYLNFLHGVDHSDIYKELGGYYPPVLSMNGKAYCHTTAKQTCAARTPLTLTDGLNILKKLAGADLDSWTNVMTFLPFNEKCGLAQYLSTATCERVYGVKYPVKIPPPRRRSVASTFYVFSNNLLSGLEYKGRTYPHPHQAVNLLANTNVTTNLSLFLGRSEFLESSDQLQELALRTCTGSAGDPPPTGQWGLFRERLVTMRMSEIKTMGHASEARRKQPFHALWHLKTTYDLSNFCNRHNVRCVALQTIARNIQENIVPLIESVSKRMTDMCVTRVEIDGSQEQAFLAAQHTLDHNRYMQAWRDMATLTILARFEGEPSITDTAACFVKWQRHAAFCRLHQVVPEYHVPFLHTTWHINRLHAFIAVLYRYMGKQYNDLLVLVADSDCALRHDISQESAHGRSTVLNLLSYQISVSINIDMNHLFIQCMKHTYHKMDCNLPTTPYTNSHTCPVGGTCYGCDCHPLAKAETAQYVERMFASLEAYNSCYNVDLDEDDKYAMDWHFLHPTSYTDVKIQRQLHQSRKRFCRTPSINTATIPNQDQTTLTGIEPLMNGAATRFEPAPEAYVSLCYSRSAS